MAEGPSERLCDLRSHAGAEDAGTGGPEPGYADYLMTERQLLSPARLASRPVKW